MQIVFTVLLPVLLVLTIVYAARRDRKRDLDRSQAREAWARRQSLKLLDPVNPDAGIFSRRRDQVPTDRYKDLTPISPLSAGSAINFIEGQVAGRQVRVFDHRYVVSTGKSSHVVYHGVVAVSFSAQTPSFELRPHRFWDKVNAMFGKRDIELGYTDLDEMFYISADDERFIQTLIDPQTELRLRDQPKTRMACQDSNTVMLQRKLCTDQDFDAMLETALWLAARIEAQQKR